MEEGKPTTAAQPEAMETEVSVNMGDDQDPELLAMQQRLKEMEDEDAKIEAMQNQVEQSMKPATPDSGPDADKRSIYVGNVDYSVTCEELQAFFQSCGQVNRITILCDKFTGHPKGFAYVQFADEDAVQNAVLLNNTELKGRLLKISPKRTNVPGLSQTVRGRGRPYMPPYGGFRPRRRPNYAAGYPPAGGYQPRPRYRRRPAYHPYY